MSLQEDAKGGGRARDRIVVDVHVDGVCALRYEPRRHVIDYVIEDGAAGRRYVAPADRMVANRLWQHCAIRSSNCNP